MNSTQNNSKDTNLQIQNDQDTVDPNKQPTEPPNEESLEILVKAEQEEVEEDEDQSEEEEKCDSQYNQQVQENLNPQQYYNIHAIPYSQLRDQMGEEIPSLDSYQSGGKNINQNHIQKDQQGQNKETHHDQKQQLNTSISQNEGSDANQSAQQERSQQADKILREYISKISQPNINQLVVDLSIEASARWPLQLYKQRELINTFALINQQQHNYAQEQLNLLISQKRKGVSRLEEQYNPKKQRKCSIESNFDQEQPHIINGDKSSNEIQEAHSQNKQIEEIQDSKLNHQENDNQISIEESSKQESKNVQENIEKECKNTTIINNEDKEKDILIQENCNEDKEEQVGNSKENDSQIININSVSNKDQKEGDVELEEQRQKDNSKDSQKASRKQSQTISSQDCILEGAPDSQGQVKPAAIIEPKKQKAKEKERSKLKQMQEQQRQYMYQQQNEKINILQDVMQLQNFSQVLQNPMFAPLLPHSNFLHLQQFPPPYLDAPMRSANFEIPPQIYPNDPQFQQGWNPFYAHLQQSAAQTQSNNSPPGINPIPFPPGQMQNPLLLSMINQQMANQSREYPIDYHQLYHSGAQTQAFQQQGTSKKEKNKEKGTQGQLLNGINGSKDQYIQNNNIVKQIQQ